jgi:serine/alanine adding enzyme
MNLPDIYFEPAWGELYATKDNGSHQTFLLNSEIGRVYYSFVKRPIEIIVEGKLYYDIISAYGFGGPIVLDCMESKKSALLMQFKEQFDAYCMENDIVTDTCRFNPWLKNHADFTHMYELIPNYTTLGIDLSVENLFMDEISSKKRNMIRKANKLGVNVHVDYEGKNLDAFIAVYEKTIVKHKISTYYRFSKEFLLDNFHKLKGKIFLAYALYDGKVISIAIFLLSEHYIHYHLAANDMDYNSVPANDLLLYEVAEFGKRNGFKYLMLGGAGGNVAIHSHKKGFTKESVFDFYKGKRICNPEIYEKLLINCEKVDLSFFPSYR